MSFLALDDEAHRLRAGRADGGLVVLQPGGLTAKLAEDVQRRPARQARPVLGSLAVVRCRGRSLVCNGAHRAEQDRLLILVLRLVQHGYRERPERGRRKQQCAAAVGLRIPLLAHARVVLAHEQCERAAPLGRGTGLRGGRGRRGAPGPGTALGCRRWRSAATPSRPGPAAHRRPAVTTRQDPARVEVYLVMGENGLEIRARRTADPLLSGMMLLAYRA